MYMAPTLLYITLGGASNGVVIVKEEQEKCQHEKVPRRPKNDGEQWKFVTVDCHMPKHTLIYAL